VSDNYYILLGLDPAVDDWTVIEAKIKDCQRRWSMQKNQGAPKDKRIAERHLKLIPDMQTKLRDPTARRAIAREAEKELKEQKVELFSKLDELIGMIHETTIDADGVKLLVRQVGGGMSEPEVVARLKARGITVASGGSAKSAPKVRPKLERTIAQSIRDNLRHTGLKSLYDFLGLGPRSSPKSLYDSADEVYKEIRRKGLTDPDSTARQELAGHAKAVFKDATEKERYDNTYAVEAMEELTNHLEFAGRDSFLDPREIDDLVREARAKGVDQDAAIEYIEEYAQKRKWNWVPQRASDLPSEELKLCGFCNAIARTPKDTRCHNCGQEFVQPCPRCGQPTATQDECCGSCGCSTGDAPLVQGLLWEGQEHLAEGDLARALSCFERALIYWESWQPAIEGKRRVEATRSALESALEAVDGLLRARKLEEAQSALDRLRREFGSAETEDLGSRVEAGMVRARDAFRAAEALRAAGKGEDAVDKFSEALGYCADFQPALRALAASPPPAPSALRVTMAGATAQLGWTPVRARGTVTYRIQRKASGAPTGPEDGTTIGEVQAATCHDTSVPPGTPWYYSVFAVRGGVASAVAASSGPHLRLADPTSVIVEAGEGQVSLRWSRPPGCKAVEVWRESGGAPAAPGKGTRVAVSGDSAVDQGLKNGASYGYLIVACFTDPVDGRGVVRAPGVGVVATPVAPPPAVEDLRARREDRVVILTWTSPARGDVQIRQTRQTPSFSPGRIVPLATADEYGAPVAVTGRGTTQTTLDGQGRLFFIPLSVIAQTAVLGAPVAVTTLDEVTNIEAQRQGNTINLTWTWPAGAVEAHVAWRHDTYPTNPEDASGGRRPFTRSEYDRSGLWALRNAARARHYFTVFVRDPDADIYSSGAHVVEASGLESQVTYRVVTRRSLLRRAIQEAWVDLRTKDDVRTLPALLAVLQEGFPPTRPENGRTIASLDRLTFQDGAARIDLPANGATGFVKLFFKDGRHAREIRLLPAAKEQLRLG